MEIKEVNDKHEKREISEIILKALPEWFGIPEATQEYIDKSAYLPFFAAYEELKPIGFVAVKENSPFTAEIYVMGVLSDHHRQGIGRALIREVINWSCENGYEFLQVKTLDASHPDAHYVRTRAFYQSMGFKPFECIPELWGKENPCLIMLQSLKK